MAGGDGSQALVASVASRHGIPFVVIPAGHPQPLRPRPGHRPRGRGRCARRLRRTGSTGVIDLAEVNGRVFVNNASMGVYAKIVQSAGLPRRQGPHGGRRPCRTCSGRTRCRSTCGSPSRRASRPRRRTWSWCRTTPTSSRTCAARPPGPGSTAAGSASSRCWCAARRTPRSSPRWRPPGRSAGSRAGTSGPPTEFEVDVGRAGRGRRRRRGPDPGAAAALRDPARSPDRAAAPGRALAPDGRAGRARRVGADAGALWRTALGRPAVARMSGDGREPATAEPASTPVEPVEERLARRLERARGRRGTRSRRGPRACCTGSGAATARPTWRWPGCRRRRSTCR